MMNIEQPELSRRSTSSSKKTIDFDLQHVLESSKIDKRLQNEFHLSCPSSATTGTVCDFMPGFNRVVHLVPDEARFSFPSNSTTLTPDRCSNFTLESGSLDSAITPSSFHSFSDAELRAICMGMKAAFQSRQSSPETARNIDTYSELQKDEDDFWELVSIMKQSFKCNGCDGD